MFYESKESFSCIHGISLRFPFRLQFEQLQPTSYYFHKSNFEGSASSTEQPSSLVRSSYSCAPQQHWCMTNSHAKKCPLARACYFYWFMFWTAAILLQAFGLQTILSCRNCWLTMTVPKRALSKKRYWYLPKGK